MKQHLEDEQMFSALIDAEYEGLLRYTKSVLKNRGKDFDAEDAVQEMLIFAWKNRDKLFSSEKPVGWLYRVLYFKTLEIIRDDNKWLKNLLALETAFESAVEESPSNDSISSLVSEEEYEILRLIYVDGYSYQEICKKYNLSKSALGMRINRIKKKLQKFLS